MIDDQLLDQLNNLLGTFVKSQEASTDFGPRWIFGSILERSSKRGSIEEETGLSDLESDSQAVDYLSSALSFAQLTTWGWMVASRGSFSIGTRGRRDSGKESLTIISSEPGLVLTSSQLGIERSNGRIGDRCRLCLLMVSSSLRYGTLSSRYQ